MTVTPIASIQNAFQEKFGVPFQSNQTHQKSTIVFEPPFRNPDALRGLADFSHLWLLWGFSANRRKTWSPMVRPPRLGGNARMGVFATRSPVRPNPIGLSSVRLAGIQLHSEKGPLIHVLGADLMDKTPIYDIKPYLAFADSHPEATGGFAADPHPRHLQVLFQISETTLKDLPQSLRQDLSEILACDPRPSYHQDPNRRYGMQYGGYEVKFFVSQGILTVTEIEKKQG